MNRAVAGEQTHARPTLSVIVAVLLGLILTLSVGSAPAAAHAELLESSPQDGAVLEIAPSSAELRFNENVQLIDGAIRLFPGDGSEPLNLSARAVDTTVIIDLPADLADGAYALSYRVVSADTHPVGGAITFQIGTGTPAALLPETTGTAEHAPISEATVSVLSGLQYLALLIFAGLLIFDRLVLRTTQPTEKRTQRLVGAALATAIIVSLLLIVATAIRIVGAPAHILIPSTWLPGVQPAPVITAGLVTVAGITAILGSSRGAYQSGRVLALTGAVAAVSAPVLVGHTRTVLPGWLIVPADIGHLLAGAFWTGGVLGLLLFLHQARPTDPTGQPRTAADLAGRIIVRFSRIALVSVILLALSGTVMAALIVDSWGDLIETGYGRTLLLKLGVVAAVIALAAWNRTRLLPRITARPAGAPQWQTLRRTLTYEAALLITIVAITGILTNTSPTHTHQHTAPATTSQETPVHVISQGMTVDGTLSPTRTGTNTFTFHLEYNEEPITGVDIRVEARLPERELGPITATPRSESGAGDYVVDVTLPTPGHWQIHVSARVDTYTQPIAIIPIVID